MSQENVELVRRWADTSGIEIGLEWAILLDFQAGEVTSWRWFLDRAEALQAVGLGT